MEKYKNLVNNSIVFTIGTFGSKLISFLMVPLYTHLLTTGEYGTVDIMNTTISSLIPLLTLELGQASLRYSIEARNSIEQNKIFSNISTHSILITLVVFFMLPILNRYNLFENYILMFTILLVLRVINDLFSHYIRGIGLVKEFAINGILMTSITVLSNIVLLVFLNFKVEGYIYSLILAALGSNLYLFYASKGLARLKFYNPDKKLFKEMLKYSIPIVPNSAMWWIINSSTRFFILYFIDVAANGIYAVSNKIPAIISMATGVFSQAWQLTSFEEFESDNKDEFYTSIFNIYWVFLFIGGSLILVIIKPLLTILIEESFYSSWQVAPLLILAVIYQSFSSFLGTNYTAAKETKGSFSTSVFAGIISILSSIVFIPILGLIGAGLSSAISFFSMFIIRLIDTKKYVKIELHKKSFVITNIIFILQILVLFIFDGLLMVVIELALFFITLLTNIIMIKLIFKKSAQFIFNR